MKNMFIGFGEAVRDIFTTWLASIFAGAVLCTFAKCPKLQSIQPPFISLPDWYVFEDFCADLCRTPLIEGRIRDYITCVNKCITSIAPRSPTETVVVTEAGRTTAYVDESLIPVDAFANVSKQTMTESVSLSDTASTTTRDRRVFSEGESIGLSETYNCVAVTRTIQSLGEPVSLSEAINAFVAQRIVVNVSEGSGISESISTQIPSVAKVDISEGFSSSDKMPEWVPLPSIAPYARWIEAVNEYIDPYYGTSMVATDTLTGEVITAGEVGRTTHDTDTVSDATQVETRPGVWVLPSDTTQGLETDTATYYLLRSVASVSPYVITLSTLLPHSIRVTTPVKLVTPSVQVFGVTIPPIPSYLKTAQLTSPSRLAIYALMVYAIRTRIGAKLTSPARLSTYILMPHAVRTRTGIQLTSPARLSTYILMPHAVRTRTGIQLTSPARTSAQITITV
jgi:hypothetical protein